MDMQNAIIGKIINKAVCLLGNKPLSQEETKTRILLDTGVDVDSADKKTLDILLDSLTNTGWPKKVATSSSKAPTLSDLDIDSLEDISIIDPLGVVRGGYKIMSRQPDRNGLVSVLDSSGKNVIRIHPTRVHDSECEGSTAIDYGDKLVAACPECGSIRKVRQTTGKCECGKFKIINTIAHELPSARSTQKKVAEIVDLSDLAKKGEIWAKHGVPFDDPNTEVTAISYRVGDYYLSFNLYNGSLGKKEPKRAEAKQRIVNLQGGVNLDKSKGPPYKISSLEAWRKKLSTNGYKQFT